MGFMGVRANHEAHERSQVNRFSMALKARALNSIHACKPVIKYNIYRVHSVAYIASSCVAVGSLGLGHGRGTRASDRESCAPVHCHASVGAVNMREHMRGHTYSHLMWQSQVAVPVAAAGRCFVAWPMAARSHANGALEFASMQQQRSRSEQPSSKDS